MEVLDVKAVVLVEVAIAEDGASHTEKEVEIISIALVMVEIEFGVEVTVVKGDIVKASAKETVVDGVLSRQGLVDAPNEKIYYVF